MNEKELQEIVGKSNSNFKILIENKSFVTNNIDKFVNFNLNQKSLINVIKEIRKSEIV